MSLVGIDYVALLAYMYVKISIYVDCLCGVILRTWRFIHVCMYVCIFYSFRKNVCVVCGTTFKRIFCYFFFLFLQILQFPAIFLNNVATFIVFGLLIFRLCTILFLFTYVCMYLLYIYIYIYCFVLSESWKIIIDVC